MNVSKDVLAIPVAILIAGMMISGSILYTGPSPAQQAAIGNDLTQEGPVVADIEGLADDDPSLGEAAAPVTIVEFSDFQCPYCRQFYSDTYQQLKRAYVDTGLARIVYRDFPLDFHAAARPSALAAECADEQGRFWDYHDKIFDAQAVQGTGTISYGTTELKQWARDIGLNASQFDLCLDSEKYGDDVDADMEAGKQAGVSGTPSFFVNGRLLIGAQPFSAFEQLIEAELDN